VDQLFIIHNGLVDRHSHYYGESKGWCDACRDRGIVPRLYINSRALPAIVEELSAVPTFTFVPDEILEEKGKVSDFITLSEAFAEACAVLQRDGIAADDVIVVPYSTEREIFGAALWLEHIPVAQRPAIVFIFCIPDLSWTFDKDRNKCDGDFSYFRYAMKRMRAAMPAEKVILYATTSRLAALLMKMLQHPCEECPQPTYYVGNDVLLAPDEQTGPWVNVRVAGQLRREKGADLLVPVMLRVAERRPGTSFAVQVNDMQDAQAIAEALAPLTKSGSPCYLQYGQSGHELYQRRLQYSDILLLPYRWERYALRTSNVFSEAVGFGLVTVVPDHTWMADKLNEGWGAGTTFRETTADDITAALTATIDARPSLSEQARRKAPDWRHVNSVGALLDKIVRRMVRATDRPDARR
jgi:glycosyltransferase involved in cell wall biosynthesis